MGDSDRNRDINSDINVQLFLIKFRSSEVKK